MAPSEDHTYNGPIWGSYLQWLHLGIIPTMALSGDLTYNGYIYLEILPTMTPSGDHTYNGSIWGSYLQWLHPGIIPTMAPSGDHTYNGTIWGSYLQWLHPIDVMDQLNWFHPINVDNWSNGIYQLAVVPSIVSIQWVLCFNRYLTWKFMACK